MTAYLIGKLAVQNWDWYAEYQSVTEPLVAEHGGSYLVKGGRAQILEGDGAKGDATVVIAFPSRQDLMSWYCDPRYQSMIALRKRSGTITDLVVVDGLDEPS